MIDYEKIKKESYKKAIEIINIINETSDLFYLDSIQFRIKTFDNINLKYKNIKENFKNVYDLVGIRVIIDNLDEIYILKDKIINNPLFSDVKVYDYLINGRIENKEYKAMHIQLVYKNIPCEIQLLTCKMFNYLILTHESYKLNKYSNNS